MMNSWHGLVKATKDVEAAEIHSHSKQAGAKSINELKSGDIAEVQGIVRSVLYLPASEAPQFKFEVYDGTAMLCVIFLGRSSIIGIDPGVELKLQGRVTQDHKNLTMFNPSYTLIKDNL